MPLLSSPPWESDWPWGKCWQCDLAACFTNFCLLHSQDSCSLWAETHRPEMYKLVYGFLPWVMVHANSHPANCTDINLIEACCSIVELCLDVIFVLHYMYLRRWACWPPLWMHFPVHPPPQFEDDREFNPVLSPLHDLQVWDQKKQMQSISVQVLNGGKNLLLWWPMAAAWSDKCQWSIDICRYFSVDRYISLCLLTSDAPAGSACRL